MDNTTVVYDGEYDSLEDELWTNGICDEVTGGLLKPEPEPQPPSRDSILIGRLIL